MVWSKTTRSLYCFSCCLFNEVPPSAARSLFSHPKMGYNDNWRKLHDKVKSHEQSVNHANSYISWKYLLVALEVKSGVDSHFQRKLCEEKARWRQILKALLGVTLFLAERHLAFRGLSSTIGEIDNGNFLGLLELLSSYHLITKQHLDDVKGHQMKGQRKQAHYLSWQTKNEFITLCANKVRETVIADLHKAYYYGLIVDGTPAISHTEQLTFVLRYAMLKGRNWHVVERFLSLKDFEKKKGKEIAEAICEILEERNINLKYCRGQGYDNGSNMSGCYKGVHAVILRENPEAIYAPCSAHSLNLCGVHAVEASNEVKLFFGNIQKMYNFFSSSPARWKILKETVGVTLHS